MTGKIRETEDGERVGNKMYKAVKATYKYEAFASMNQLAIFVGPHGSQDYGYRIVKRCLRKDLIELDEDHEEANVHGRGAVVLTQKGRRFVEREMEE